MRQTIESEDFKNEQGIKNWQATVEQNGKRILIVRGEQPDTYFLHDQPLVSSPDPKTFMQSLEHSKGMRAYSGAEIRAKFPENTLYKGSLPK
jgi:hypothetical protein